MQVDFIICILHFCQLNLVIQTLFFTELSSFSRSRTRRFAPVLTLPIKQTESLDGSARDISHVGNFQAKDLVLVRLLLKEMDTQSTQQTVAHFHKVSETTQPRRISRAIALSYVLRPRPLMKNQPQRQEKCKLGTTQHNITSEMTQHDLY